MSDERDDPVAAYLAAQPGGRLLAYATAGEDPAKSMVQPADGLTEPERLRQFGVIRGAAQGDLVRMGLADGQRAWGDHLRMEFMIESKPGEWWFMHISPDTMEALADELRRRAKLLRGR